MKSSSLHRTRWLQIDRIELATSIGLIYISIQQINRYKKLLNEHVSGNKQKWGKKLTIEMRENKIIFNQDLRTIAYIVFVHHAYDNYFILKLFLWTTEPMYMMVYVSSYVLSFIVHRIYNHSLIHSIHYFIGRERELTHSMNSFFVLIRWN